MLVLGHPSRVEHYLANEGRAEALAWAREVWNDADRLAEFECGLVRLPAPVERELDRLIHERNARD